MRSSRTPRLICATSSSAPSTPAGGGRILTLRRDDIDLDRRVLYFNQTNTTSGKQREVPIDDILHAVLKARLKVRSIGVDGDYLFHRRGRRLNNIRTAFDAARNGAGLGSDVGFHTLRHTFASWFMINGGDLYRLQRYLGHSTITLTQRYAHLSRSHMADGARFFGAPTEQAQDDERDDSPIGTGDGPRG